MKFVRSFCMALAMYSKLPVPQVEWREENMAYAMCFFPVVGACIGLLMFAVLALANLLALSRALTAALLTVLPLAVTGGIHMDGFCDVADALSSHAPKEKKLEIMKDPRAGAFAVIGLRRISSVDFWTMERRVAWRSGLRRPCALPGAFTRFGARLPWLHSAARAGMGCSLRFVMLRIFASCASCRCCGLQPLRG